MPDDLCRFIDAQKNSYETALAELISGVKRSHWIWYIFPQIKGLGHSWNSNYYGIHDIAEARQFLQHPLLGNRLRICCKALLDLETKDIFSIMADIDVVKLKSSMTLFDAVSPNDIFSSVLGKYYNGKRDQFTLSIINAH